MILGGMCSLGARGPPLHVSERGVIINVVSPRSFDMVGALAIVRLHHGSQHDIYIGSVMSIAPIRACCMHDLVADEGHTIEVVFQHLRRQAV